MLIVGAAVACMDERIRFRDISSPGCWWRPLVLVRGAAWAPSWHPLSCIKSEGKAEASMSFVTWELHIITFPDALWKGLHKA